MTSQEKQDLINEIIPELTKGLVPVLKEAIVEEMKQHDPNQNDVDKNQQQATGDKKIDYAALVKEALK